MIKNEFNKFIFSGKEPFPMIVLPDEITWWSESENCHESVQTSDEDVSRVYRAHFLQTEHYNFTCHLFPPVFSDQISSDGSSEKNGLV